MSCELLFVAFVESVDDRSQSLHHMIVADLLEILVEKTNGRIGSPLFVHKIDRVGIVVEIGASFFGFADQNETGEIRVIDVGTIVIKGVHHNPGELIEKRHIRSGFELLIVLGINKV